MKKTNIKNYGWLYVISAFIFSSFFFPIASLAAIDIPWSTTFKCADWLKYSDSLDCDGIQKGGDWATSNRKIVQIVDSANNPGGGGGKGELNWIGDGVNNDSGGLVISFNEPQAEVWVRWYQKYQLGFTWDPAKGLLYTKTLYFNMGKDSSFNTGYNGTDRWQIEVYGDSPQIHYLNSGGWNTVMKNGQSNGSYRKSDGKWHCYEIHVKRQTSGANGIFELWLDGVHMGRINNLTFRGTSLFKSFQIPSNQKTVANGGDRYVFIDDIAISNTGYIPPLKPVAGLGLPDTTSPQVPQQFKLSLNNY